MKDTNFFDTSFTCSDSVTLNAHTAILHLRCPPLYDMLQNGEAGRLQLATFNSAVLRALLPFVYTDATPPNLAAVAVPLASLAKDFKLRRLEAQCAQLLTDSAVLEGNSCI